MINSNLIKSLQITFKLSRKSKMPLKLRIASFVGITIKSDNIKLPWRAPRVGLR